ncbi:MAG: rod shape-determining protein MreD [Cellvibrionaceae bacterium]
MKFFITISFVIAFVLMVIPISHDLKWCRPEFIVLLVIYWTMYAPQHLGLGTVWLVGLFQDILELSFLGLNAIGMLLIAYILHLVYQRLRNYVFWHQALWVFVLVGVFQLFSNWLNGFMGYSADSPVFLLSAVFSGLLWPFLVILMGRLQVYFRLIQ